MLHSLVGRMEHMLLGWEMLLWRALELVVGMMMCVMMLHGLL